MYNLSATSPKTINKIPDGTKRKDNFPRKRMEGETSEEKKAFSFLELSPSSPIKPRKKVKQRKEQHSNDRIAIVGKKGFTLALDYSTVHASESLLEGWEVELKPMVRGLPSLA